MSVAQMEGPGCARSAWSTHRASCGRLLFLGHIFATCAQVFLAHQKLGFLCRTSISTCSWLTKRNSETIFMFQKKRQKVKNTDECLCCRAPSTEAAPQQRGPRQASSQAPSSSAVSECLCRLCGSVSRRVLRRLLGKDFHSLLLGDLPQGLNPVSCM